MKLILISANGNGAGKTTLANNITTNRMSLSDAMRKDLDIAYPNLPWFSRDQSVKNTYFPEINMTLREKLIEYGQSKCIDNDIYWCERLRRQFEEDQIYRNSELTVAIDDIRKICEHTYFKSYFPDCSHIHVSYLHAKFEPEFDNLELKNLADYIIMRNK